MDYVIETDFQGPGFVAVPNHVAQNAAISPEALGVLVYLASQPRGYIARWAAICERFGMGRDRWQRIARELRAVGAMQLHTVRGPGGRAIGRRVSVQWPDAPLPSSDKGSSTENRKTRFSAEKPQTTENRKTRFSAKVSRETRKSEPGNPAPYKEERKKPAPGGTAGRGQAVTSSSPERIVRRLSPFVRSQLRNGATVLAEDCNGASVLLVAGSAAHEAVQSALNCLERV